LAQSVIQVDVIGTKATEVLGREVNSACSFQPVVLIIGLFSRCCGWFHATHL